MLSPTLLWSRFSIFWQRVFQDFSVVGRYAVAILPYNSPMLLMFLCKPICGMGSFGSGKRGRHCCCDRMAKRFTWTGIGTTSLGFGFTPLRPLVMPAFSRFHFALRFWNQILTWTSLRWRALAICDLSLRVRYFLLWNSFSSSSSWSLVKAVLRRRDLEPPRVPHPSPSPPDSAWSSSGSSWSGESAQSPWSLRQSTSFFPSESIKVTQVGKII